MLAAAAEPVSPPAAVPAPVSPPATVPAPVSPPATVPTPTASAASGQIRGTISYGRKDPAVGAVVVVRPETAVSPIRAATTGTSGTGGMGIAGTGVGGIVGSGGTAHQG